MPGAVHPSCPGHAQPRQAMHGEDTLTTENNWNAHNYFNIHVLETSVSAKSPTKGFLMDNSAAINTHQFKTPSRSLWKQKLSSDNVYIP